jgi:hypothetical protein
MLKSTIKVVLLSSLISSGAFAQEVFKLNSFGGGFNFHVGYQSYNPGSYFSTDPEKDLGIADKLYSVSAPTQGSTLTTESYASFKKPSSGLINMGFQGFGVFNSFIVGGELNFNYGAQNNGEHIDSTFEGTAFRGVSIASTSSRLIGSDVLLNVGFIALRKRALIVYPMIGIGYGATGLWLKSEATRRLYPDIAAVVTDEDPNLQNIFIWTRTAILDFGLGAQYMLGASTEDKAKGFSLGFRFGYKWQPQTNNILVNANKNVKDGLPDELKDRVPNVGLSGLYFKVLIGFGKIGESN